MTIKRRSAHHGHGHRVGGDERRRATGAAMRRHQGRPAADSDVAQRGRLSVQCGRPVRQVDQRLHRVADGGDAVVAAFRSLHLLGPERRRKGGSFRCGHRPG